MMKYCAVKLLINSLLTSFAHLLAIATDVPAENWNKIWVRYMPLFLI